MNILVLALQSTSLDAEALLNAVREELTKGPSQQSLIYLVLISGAVIILLVLGARWAAHKRKTPFAPRENILPNVLDVLPLSSLERQDLVQVAETARLQEPVAMLVSPNNFRVAAERSLQRSFDAHRKARLSRISTKLFDEDVLARRP
jgi:hypothetical protein